MNKIAILTRGVSGGGVQKMSVNLANQLAVDGWKVDLLSPVEGDSSNVDPRVNIIIMRPSLNVVSRWYCVKAAPDLLKELFLPVIIPIFFPKSLSFVKYISNYMKMRKPVALISATTYFNIAALLSKRLARENIKILISERTNLSGTINSLKNKFFLRWRFVTKLVSRIYIEADAIVAVSDGVGYDLALRTGLDLKKIKTINNPVISSIKNIEFGKKKIFNPKLKDNQTNRPHFVVVGRLVSVKRIDLAIKAFDLFLKNKGEGKLTILGDGPRRKSLEHMVLELKLERRVIFEGWHQEPQEILKCADVCLLTSQREGSPNILVEAMHHGCQIVATNCPNGPSEILKNGRLGKLVNSYDPELISQAMVDIVENPIDTRLLENRSLDYTAVKSAREYLNSLGF